MPSISRTFDDFARLAPQVDARGGGAFSAAGRNNKYNSIQIDGAVNNDLFGLSGSGAPGLSAPISLDAVQEFELVLAPYDVRYGGFTGAGLNAITRSGTNTFSRIGLLLRPQPELHRQGPRPDSLQHLLGEASSGSAWAARWSRTSSTSSSAPRWAAGTSPTTYVIDDSGASNDFGGANVSIADAQRFVDILKNKYGYDPGGFGAGYKKVESNNDKIFFRLDSTSTPRTG